MLPTNETSQALLDDLDTGWDDLQRALDGITDEELLEPGMTGTWSGKDTLAHITRWDAYATRAITALVNGQDPIDGGYRAVIDRLLVTNEIWAAEDAHRPLVDVKRDFADNHAGLIALLRGLPNADVRGEVRMWVLALIEHYPEHTPLIDAWRAARS